MTIEVTENEFAQIIRGLEELSMRQNANGNAIKSKEAMELAYRLKEQTKEK